MTARSHDRGWPIYRVGNWWRYEDTDETVTHKRPCKRCGEPPTPEGHDACLGHVPGAISACCGHGVVEPLVMSEEIEGEKS